jgi:hypothetical protein
MASFLDVKKRVGHGDAWTPRKTLAITNPPHPVPE